MLSDRVIRMLNMDDTRSQVPGLSRQVPGSDIRVQGQVQGPHPHPNLTTRAWIPIAET